MPERRSFRSDDGTSGVVIRLWVAIVHSVDGIHLVASGHEESTYTSVGEYVRSHAQHMLWPEEAARVEELLRERRAREAVDLYFARVGERWDREWLLVREVDADLDLPARPLRSST